MDLFNRLATAATRQSEEADLPSFLLADIMRIAGSPERYAGKAFLVELLIGQIEEFDSYAGAGCFGGAVSAGTIKATIEEILAAGPVQ